jgi:hypothetical protein
MFTSGNFLSISPWEWGSTESRIWDSHLRMSPLICGKYFANKVKPKKIRLVFTVHFGYISRMPVKNMSLHCTIHAKKCAQMCTILYFFFYMLTVIVLSSCWLFLADQLSPLPEGHYYVKCHVVVHTVLYVAAELRKLNTGLDLVSTTLLHSCTFT